MYYENANKDNMTSPEENAGGGNDPQAEILWQIIRETLQQGGWWQPEEGYGTIELPADPTDVVRSACLQEAQSAFDELQLRLETNTDLTPDGATAAGVLLYTLICDAGERRDLEQIGTCTDTLNKIEKAPGSILAAGYFAGAMAGSEYAKTALEARLTKEKKRAKWHPTGTEGTTQRRPNSPLLEGVMEACQNNDIPPDVWISDYATDDRHAWFLHTIHYQSVRSSERVASIDETSRLEEIIASGYERHSPAYARQTGPMALSLLLNPDARARVLAHYARSLSRFSPTDSTGISGIHRVLSEAIWDTNLSRHPALADIVSFLDASGLEPTSGLDNWQIDRRALEGSSASELLQFMDELTRESMANSMYNIQEELALNSRDMLLSNYARLLARRGNFDGANILLGAIGALEVREFTLTSCLQQARTNSDVTAISPSASTQAIAHPELKTPIEIYNAMQSHNITTLETMAFDFATQPAQPPYHRGRSATAYSQAQHAYSFDRSAPPPHGIGSMIGENRRAHYIQELHRAVANEDSTRGQQLARNLLAILRTQNRTDNSQSIRYLSESLLRTRDPNEIQHAYSMIGAQRMDPRMTALKIINLTGQAASLPRWLLPLLGPY